MPNRDDPIDWWLLSNIGHASLHRKHSIHVDNSKNSLGKCSSGLKNSKFSVDSCNDLVLSRNNGSSSSFLSNSLVSTTRSLTKGKFLSGSMVIPSLVSVIQDSFGSPSTSIPQLPQALGCLHEYLKASVPS